MMSNKRSLAPLLVVTALVLGVGPIVAPQGQTLPPLAQDPRDQAPPATVGTAVISGVVSVADSGQPARRARVSLSSGELRISRTVTTDETGRFTFAALPAGRYSLSASKPGHVSVSYGQRQPGPGRPGTPIQLGDAQKLQTQLQLVRGSVITGTVLDEHGEAIPGTPVRALRYVMQSGHRVLQQSNSGATDDRGIYRIYALQPGEYLVSASPRNLGPTTQVERMRAELTALQSRAEAMAGSDATAARQMLQRMAEIKANLPTEAADETVTGYAPVYYPGTTVAASAGVVAVGPGEEKTAVDFQLQLVPIARVDGVVVAASGPLPGTVQVSLYNVGQDVPGAGSSSTRPDREGRFQIPNVPPGQYVLVARGTTGAGRGMRGEAPGLPTPNAGRGAAPAGPEPTRLYAMTDVSIDGRNVSNLVLTLQPGMTISGRIVFEGATPAPADLTRLRVSASPVVGPGPAREFANTVTGRVDAAGRFTITGVLPGRYRISGSNAQGWTAASSVVGSQDTLDFPVEVKPNQNVSGVVLTFTDRQAELTGTILNERAQPAPEYTIIVYAAEREFWKPNSRRILSQRPGTDGRFTFRNLPPGEYRIAPVLDPEPGTWYDPAFLQQLESIALGISIGQGEQKVQNLRVGG